MAPTDSAASATVFVIPPTPTRAGDAVNLENDASNAATDTGNAEFHTANAVNDTGNETNEARVALLAALTAPRGSVKRWSVTVMALRAAPQDGVRRRRFAGNAELSTFTV